MEEPQKNKKIIDRAWKLQRRLEERQKRIGMGKYGRVFKMAHKPTSEEYTKTSQITGLGILLIGLIGFVIFLITAELAPWVAEQLGIV